MIKFLKFQTSQRSLILKILLSCMIIRLLDCIRGHRTALLIRMASIKQWRRNVFQLCADSKLGADQLLCLYRFYHTWLRFWYDLSKNFVWTSTYVCICSYLSWEERAQKQLRKLFISKIECYDFHYSYDKIGTGLRSSPRYWFWS